MPRKKAVVVVESDPESDGRKTVGQGEAFYDATVDLPDATKSAEVGGGDKQPPQTISDQTVLQMTKIIS